MKQQDLGVYRLPYHSIIRIEPPFKTLDLANAILDGIKIIFLLLILLAMAGCLPLVLALLWFGWR